MNTCPAEVLSRMGVSRETAERLSAFVALVEKWNPHINLVSRHSLSDIWTRHVLDSVQVFREATAGKHWVDLGSGGGFPGLIAAIVAVEERPSCHFTLIESDQRKSAFLRTASRETGAKVKVLSKRIERLEGQHADTLSARALADLTTLLGFTEQHLDQNGTALFPKGASWKKELEAARQYWRFDCESARSWTEAEAVILKITGVERV